jgi:hypothetical protein
MVKHKISFDDKCPECKSTEWKLCRLIFASETSALDAKSTGGGGGISVGIGDGQRGASINYQSLRLDTKGKIQSYIAQQYAPPSPPAEISGLSIQSLEKSRTLLRTDAEEKLEQIDDFALDKSSVKMGFFKKPHINKDSLEGQHQKLSNQISELRKYEYELSIWNATRACLRCGEIFIPNEIFEKIPTPPPEPSFFFDGMTRRCPKCNSYHWKVSQLYIDLQRKNLEESIKLITERINKAKEDEVKIAQASGLKRLWQKITAESPELLEKLQKEYRLELIKFENRIKEFPMPPAGNSLRVCLDCSHPYLFRYARG